MFDKAKFAQIIKNIKENYSSQEDFSKKSGIGRTYLSQYMNMKLDEPPKPKILKKLSSASKGIISYTELMEICGYTEPTMMQLESLKEFYSQLEENFLDILSSIKLSKDEYEVYHDLLDIIDTYSYRGLNEIDIYNKLEPYFENMDYISDVSKEKIKNKLLFFIQYCNKTFELESKIYNKKIKIQNSKSKLTTSHSSLNIIPILGKIAAGQPILAEEYIEGYLPVEPNIYGMTTSDELFYLKVSGESMNLKIHNGDYALIHKQNYAEDGDIVVAIVNGDDEATLKRYKRINNEIIMLEPMSTLPMEPIVINLKETDFKIIGKAIGQFGKF